MEHWQHLLLVLHAAKRLIGGLWKGVLRDWSTVAGARLPLQCVHDLLGNVYNVSYLAELDRLPALLNTRQLLLEQPAAGAANAAGHVAARQQSPAEPGSGSSTSRSSREQGSVHSSSSRQQRGSVSSALRELLVDGPVGPAVDLDDLLAMIMLQFDAGEMWHCSRLLLAVAPSESGHAVPEDEVVAPHTSDHYMFLGLPCSVRSCTWLVWVLKHLLLHCACRLAAIQPPDGAAQAD
jgi:hypothetical protein